MKMSRFILSAVLAMAMLLNLSTPALADDSGGEESNPVLLYLMELTGASYEEIAAYQKAGYGLGGIIRAHYFAEMTGSSFEEALNLTKGSGLGQLFKMAGLSPSGGGLGRFVSQGLGKGEGDAGPPDNAGPKSGSGAPEHAGPPEHAGQKTGSSFAEQAGPLEHAGPKGDSKAPEHAGPPEHAGRNAASEKPENAGKPEHAGAPEHAKGPKDK